jgi:phage baseplate assembly protein W
MSEYAVSTEEGELTFAPATTVQEVIQNVRMIITTPKGTVPLDREFGIDATVIDKPLAIAQAILARDIVNAVKKYEPRAKVNKVEFSDGSGAIDGVLKPIVRVEI